MTQSPEFLNQSIVYGSFGRRLSAWAIDWIACTGIAVVVSCLASFVFGPFGAVVGVIAGFFTAIAYHCAFESSHLQATPGKMLLGLQVTDINGGRISFSRALARHWGMAVSNVTCGIGYLMICNDKKRQALHDKIANCLIVSKPKVLGCGTDHSTAMAN